jgi:hypothetical protein
LNNRLLFAALGSLALHALVFALAGSNHLARLSHQPDEPKADKKVISLEFVPRAPDTPRTQAPAVLPPAVIATQRRQQHAAAATIAPHQPATQPAPATPTAEEWAFAGQYTLKNSKGYRYSWGQQVRSMMGTAVAGENAGEVRFRLEIAPDGTLARLETLWTTSSVAEQLARNAIERMPPLPPTPTGQPLIFERTIAFTPFASDWPPLYDDDCLPDPPVFANAYAWDGKSPQAARIEPQAVEKPDPQVLEECLKQLPQNSIEAEVAREQRLHDRWGSGKLGE